ncbi:hypothetical protein D9B85_14935, partial [Corynebacterium diphtheriae]
ALDGFVDPAFSNRALARLPVGLGLGFMDVILESWQEPHDPQQLGACVRASWVLLDRGARVRSCLTGLPIIALDGFVDPAFSNRALARLPVGLGLGFMDVILE